MLAFMWEDLNPSTKCCGGYLSEAENALCETTNFGQCCGCYLVEGENTFYETNKFRQTLWEANQPPPRPTQLTFLPAV